MRRKVARFDRSRADRRTSNREWHNPDDPDARVGRTKSGACDMIYKPEHIVDLESGAVISAEIRHGDEGDTAGLADRVAEAAGKVEAIHGEEHDAGSSWVLELAADKGYHDGIELAVIRHETGMRTVIPDPSRGRRRMDKLEKGVRAAVSAAGRVVATKSGKALLRARGTHLERGFAHVRQRFMKLRRGPVVIGLDNNPVDVSNVDIRLAKRTGTSRTPLPEGECISERVERDPQAMQKKPRLIRSFFAQPDTVYLHEAASWRLSPHFSPELVNCRWVKEMATRSNSPFW